MDVSQIISALGGPAKVAAHLGIPANTVVYWRRRQSVPAKHWLLLTQMDGAAVSGVTMDRLARIAAIEPESLASVEAALSAFHGETVQ